MSKPINDGGPAFPQPWADNPEIVADCPFNSSGMSLRDYFAGQFICGIAVHTEDEEIETWRHKNVAKWAYAQADAMLKARNQKGGQA